MLDGSKTLLKRHELNSFRCRSETWYYHINSFLTTYFFNFATFGISFLIFLKKRLSWLLPENKSKPKATYHRYTILFTVIWLYSRCNLLIPHQRCLVCGILHTTKALLIYWIEGMQTCRTTWPRILTTKQFIEEGSSKLETKIRQNITCVFPIKMGKSLKTSIDPPPPLTQSWNKLTEI